MKQIMDLTHRLRNAPDASVRCSSSSFHSDNSGNKYKTTVTDSGNNDDITCGSDNHGFDGSGDNSPLCQ